MLLLAKVIINYLEETLDNLYREEMHDIQKSPSLLGLFFGVFISMQTLVIITLLLIIFFLLIIFPLIISYKVLKKKLNKKN